MDWSKAKTILIIALLFTNIFLIITYGFKGSDKGEITDEQALLDVLASQNIYLDTEIPKTHSDMAALSIEFADVDQDILERAIEEANVISSGNATEATYKKEADRLIENVGLMSDSVVLDNVEMQGRNVTVSYKNEVNDVPVDGCYMRCSFKDGKIESFDYSRIKPESLSKNKRSTISAAVALMTFMNENTQAEDIHINSIEMVYWLDEEWFESSEAVADTAFAFWKITYNGDNVKHIEAYEQ